VLKGEQGSAKSTGSKILKTLIDARTAALRGSLRDVRDLVAAARNSFLVAFDNLSHLPEQLADAICRLATGGGFGGRELYTNNDEAIFEARRPVLLNAIPDLGAARGDFLDRSIILELPPIEPKKRRDEARFWKEFEMAGPRTVGGFLNAVALGLKRLPTISLPELPRMADFALGVVASEPALGLKDGEFMKAYERNQEEATGLALSASPLFEPLKAFIGAKSGNFDGTATELLNQLNLTVDEKTSKARGWPKAPMR
jgi:putative DNA primase/helicase